MNRDTLNKVFTTFSKLSKEPKTELEYSNNFTLSVAVILSAQATDISVNKATSKLFKKYDNPKDFISLGEDALKEYIKSIGLYNSKAQNIIAFSKILVDKYNSQVPSSFEELIKLPGIGRKTANIILNQAFGKPTIGVDTHVARVSRRLGLSKESKPEKIERDLLRIIDEPWLKHAHNWLVLHGRYICKARKPECSKCKIFEYCAYEGKKLN